MLKKSLGIDIYAPWTFKRNYQARIYNLLNFFHPIRLFRPIRLFFLHNCQPNMLIQANTAIRGIRVDNLGLFTFCCSALTGRLRVSVKCKFLANLGFEEGVCIAKHLIKMAMNMTKAMPISRTAHLEKIYKQLLC